MLNYEELFRKYVAMGPTSNRGWAPVLCRVCNDHGKKGVRSGFNFSDGVGYNCFNCGAAFKHSAHTVHMPSDEAIDIMAAFGIPDEAIHELRMEVIHNRTEGSDEVVKTVMEKSRVTSAPVIQQPEYFIPLADIDPDAPIRQLAEAHIREDRALDPEAYPYMIGVRTDNKDSKKWRNRLIIPVFNVAGQLIFWQGRALVDSIKPKYLSADVTREAVIFGMDQISQHTNLPLYITEGIFDAMHLNGAAVLGRMMSPRIIDMLNRSPREKIIVPDKFGDGQDLAEEGLRQGWKISTPDLGHCKDVTESVVKYGKMYTLNAIASSVYSGTAAETMLQMYCEIKKKD